MRKILMLVSKIGSPRKKEFVELIRRNFKDPESEITLGDIRNVWISAAPKPKVFVGEENIGNYDLVIFRGISSSDRFIATSISICLEKLGIKFIDRIYLNLGSTENKLAGFLRIYAAGIPVPRTVFYSGELKPDSFGKISSELGLPFVAKDLGLQRGKGVYLIDSAESFANLIKAQEERRCLFQQYVEKDHEYRVLVLGGKIGVFEEKIAKVGEFRNNVALGATEVFLNKEDIPAKIKKVALTSASLLNLDIAGVDVLIEKSTGKIILLEVNRGPGLTYDENLSPEFKELAQYLENI